MRRVTRMRDWPEEKWPLVLDGFVVFSIFWLPFLGLSLDSLDGFAYWSRRWETSIGVPPGLIQLGESMLNELSSHTTLLFGFAWLGMVAFAAIRILLDARDNAQATRFPAHPRSRWSRWNVKTS